VYAYSILKTHVSPQKCSKHRAPSKRTGLIFVVHLAEDRRTVVRRQHWRREGMSSTLNTPNPNDLFTLCASILMVSKVLKSSDLFLTYFLRATSLLRYSTPTLEKQHDSLVVSNSHVRKKAPQPRWLGPLNIELIIAAKMDNSQHVLRISTQCRKENQLYLLCRCMEGHHLFFWKGQLLVKNDPCLVFKHWRSRDCH
jgi:hypothetical protein